MKVEVDLQKDGFSEGDCPFQCYCVACAHPYCNIGGHCRMTGYYKEHIDKSKCPLRAGPVTVTARPETEREPA